VKYIAKMLLVLFLMIVAACSQPKEFKTLQVKSDVFILNGRTYATAAELTTALKTMPRPDGIRLVQEGGISTERHNEAISAVQGAKLNVPISFVGNEVFY
jgi:hypothetical protein